MRSGSSGLLEQLERQPAPDDVAEELALEHRHELFRWAAARVRETVQPATWRAFWMTSVEQHSIEEAAQGVGDHAGRSFTSRGAAC